MIQTTRIALVVLMAIAVVGAIGIGMGIQSAHASSGPKGGLGPGGVKACTPNCTPAPGDANEPPADHDIKGAMQSGFRA